MSTRMASPLRALLALAALLVAASPMAAQTPEGTVITNTATGQLHRCQRQRLRAGLGQRERHGRLRRRRGHQRRGERDPGGAQYRQLHSLRHPEHRQRHRQREPEIVGLGGGRDHDHRLPVQRHHPRHAGAAQHRALGRGDRAGGLHHGGRVLRRPRGAGRRHHQPDSHRHLAARQRRNRFAGDGDQPGRVLRGDGHPGRPGAAAAPDRSGRSRTA